MHLQREGERVGKVINPSSVWSAISSTREARLNTKGGFLKSLSKRKIYVWIALNTMQIISLKSAVKGKRFMRRWRVWENTRQVRLQRGLHRDGGCQTCPEAHRQIVFFHIISTSHSVRRARFYKDLLLLLILQCRQYGMVNVGRLSPSTLLYKKKNDLH